MRINPGDRIGALDAVETRSRIRQLPISESITAVVARLKVRNSMSWRVRRSPPGGTVTVSSPTRS